MIRALCALLVLSCGCIDLDELSDKVDQGVSTPRDSSVARDAITPQDDGGKVDLGPCTRYETVHAFGSTLLSETEPVAIATVAAGTFWLAAVDSEPVAAGHLTTFDALTSTVGDSPVPFGDLLQQIATRGPRLSKGTATIPSYLAFALNDATQVWQYDPSNLSAGPVNKMSVSCGTDVQVGDVVGSSAWVVASLCPGLARADSAGNSVVDNSAMQARLPADVFARSGFLVTEGTGGPDISYVEEMTKAAAPNTSTSLTTDHLLQLAADVTYGHTLALVAGVLPGTSLPSLELLTYSDGTSPSKAFQGGDPLPTAPIGVAGVGEQLLVVYESAGGGMAGAIYGVLFTPQGQATAPFMISSTGHRPQVAGDVNDGYFAVTYVDTFPSGATVVALKCP